MNDIDKRVKRIVGQLHGIQKMVHDQRDCVEILQQISAVKKAIDGLTSEVVSENIESLVSDEKKATVKRLIQRTINL